MVAVIRGRVGERHRRLARWVGRARGEAVKSIVGVGGRLAAEVGELGQIAGGVVGARLLQRAVGQRLIGDVGEDVEEFCVLWLLASVRLARLPSGSYPYEWCGPCWAVGLDDALQLVGGIVRVGQRALRGRHTLTLVRVKCGARGFFLLNLRRYAEAFLSDMCLY